MKVLLISHTCQARAEGHARAARLAQLPNLELRVLVPDRWRHYGQWRLPQLPEHNAFRCEVGKVAWPWVGPAQGYLHWYPHLAALLQEFQPAIIDLWEEPWGLVSAQTCWLRNRLLPHAKIITETEQNINKRLPPPFEALRAFTLRHADYAIGRSAEAVQVLRHKGYSGPASVVPNAVDANLFRPLNRAACRHALGLSGFVVGYVGRLVEEKGLMDMMEALPLCTPATNLLFVGDGPLQAALAHRAQQLGVLPQVRFLPNQPASALPQIMNAMDVLALVSRTTPSWKEQFGRVITEAHACQTPVIGSAAGAIPEVVGKAGKIVPERDPHALAAASHDLEADEARRRHLGVVGRQQVEASFTDERVAARMGVIYREVQANG